MYNAKGGLVLGIITALVIGVWLFRLSEDVAEKNRRVHKRPPYLPFREVPANYCKTPGYDEYVCWIGPKMVSTHGEFHKQIESRANSHRVIILAFVDFAFVEMAINLYEMSLKPLAITNLLFVCSDEKAVNALRRRGIDSFLYEHNIKSTKASDFGTKEFNIKVSIKMKMLTAALILGFTVLLTDVDIVFIRDPVPILMRGLDAYDIRIMSDITNDNSGFYIIRPTSAGLELQKRTLRLTIVRGMMDQHALNREMKTMGKRLRKQVLDQKQFACGVIYFEKGRRMFSSDRPCNRKTSCATHVIHNNYIVTKAAKIYRFKETGLWMYEDKGYYSSPSTKFLMYSNPDDFGDQDTKAKERASLITALTMGHILNRVVIMPKFHCQGCTLDVCKIAPGHCSFGTNFHVFSLDSQFANQYREHVFLSHPKVPNAIKKSISPEIHVIEETSAPTSRKTSANVVHFVTKDLKHVPSSEITQWFGQGSLNHVRVLRFHSLYFDIDMKDSSFAGKVNKAIRWADYRQLHVWKGK